MPEPERHRNYWVAIKNKPRPAKKLGEVMFSCWCVIQREADTSRMETIRVCNHFRTERSNWQVVNEKNPCPVCRKANNCKVSPDAKACYCWRAGGVHLFDGLSWRARESSNSLKSHKATKLKVVPSLKQYNTTSAKVHYSIASDDLADWPEHLGLREIGLRRMQTRNAGKYLIYPETWRFDSEEVDLIEAGFNRRFRDGSKYQFRDNPRGCTAWGDGNIVHVVEGMTDAATLAGVGLTVISRPGTMDVAAEICLLGDGQDLIVWGDRDGGEEKARPFAQSIADATDKKVLLAFAPEGIRDVRRWWQTWCCDNKVAPHLASDDHANQFRDLVNAHIRENAECLTRDDRLTLAKLRSIEESRTQQIISLRQQYRGKCGWIFIGHGDTDDQGLVRPFVPNLPCKLNNCGMCTQCRNEQIARDFAILTQYRWQTECDTKEEFDDIAECIHSIPVGSDDECIDRFETFAATSKNKKYVVRSKMWINERSQPYKLSSVYFVECSRYSFDAIKKQIERAAGNYKAFRVSEYGLVIVTDVAIDGAKSMKPVDAIAEIHKLSKRSFVYGASGRRVTSSRLWIVRIRASKVHIVGRCNDINRVKEIASKRYGNQCDYSPIDSENITQHLLGLPRKMKIDELVYFANEVQGGGPRFDGDPLVILDAMVIASFARRSSSMDRLTKPSIDQIRQPSQLDLPIDDAWPPDPRSQAG